MTLLPGWGAVHWFVIRLTLYDMTVSNIAIAGACLAILWLFLPRSALGEPFLVSDPYPNTERQPARFAIAAGKQKFSVPAEKQEDGSVRLKFDLALLRDGEQIIEIRAIDDRKHWGSKTTALKVVKKGSDVKISTPPEKIAPPAPPQKVQKTKIPPSRRIDGLLRPPGP